MAQLKSNRRVVVPSAAIAQHKQSVKPAIAPAFVHEGIGNRHNMPEHNQDGHLAVLSRVELKHCQRWVHAFASERKDHRYYEIVEDTIQREFEFRYFAITGDGGEVRAVQPFFILDQDLLVGASPKFGPIVGAVRRAWPRFMRVRTLMIGCAAGEGHLDGDDSRSRNSHAKILASTVAEHARRLGASIIVLKEFPAKYRTDLKCFEQCGFTRVPSLPMTKLNIDYPSFDEYMKRALNSATRTKLRRKFRIAAQAPPIDMTVVDDVTPFIGEIYPLYLQVYERSALHFEKLTEEYFCRIGRQMSDKARFFIWRQNSRIIAFALCMVEGNTVYAEYVGFDYAVALNLHLYHYVVRDMISWAIDNNYKSFRSSGLNYDPKLHLRHLLDPIDLYVRHTSWMINVALKRVLPLIEPTRYDKTLRKFSNYGELWGQTSP